MKLLNSFPLRWLRQFQTISTQNGPTMGSPDHCPFVFRVLRQTFEIDQVARAPGVVMPSSKLQVIQSKDGGVLLSLPVSAGDEVAKGQVIAALIKLMH